MMKQSHFNAIATRPWRNLLIFGTELYNVDSLNFEFRFFSYYFYRRL
jgi:hypothetical protein